MASDANDVFGIDVAGVDVEVDVSVSILSTAAAGVTGVTGAAAMTAWPTAASTVCGSMPAVVVVDEAVTVSGLVTWAELITELRAEVEATVVDGRFSAKTVTTNKRR